jgi:hypothetical protein
MKVITPEPIPFTPEGPTPLIREIPEAAPFPVTALGPLREPAEAIATATEAPVAMCAASVMASAALAAQGHRDAETLNGTAPASLFLLTVAESGERKSTADRLAMRGVRDFEAELRTEYNNERDLWRDAHEVCAFRDHPITGSDNIRSVIPI